MGMWGHRVTGSWGDGEHCPWAGGHGDMGRAGAHGTGITGDRVLVSPALLFPFLGRKMDWRSPRACFGDKKGTKQGGPIHIRMSQPDPSDGSWGCLLLAGPGRRGAQHPGVLRWGRATLSPAVTFLSPHTGHKPLHPPAVVPLPAVSCLTPASSSHSV